MREREEVFDHFITAVINTLNTDEIYDAAIEALQPYRVFQLSKRRFDSPSGIV